MESKQNTMKGIVESEKQMVLHGAKKYGDYFVNAFEFNRLLQEFIKSVDPDRYVFVMFLSQIRKHNTLAFFSVLRLHHVQAMMDLRQELEAGACASYAIANPDISGFADIDENNIAGTPKELTNKRYKWLEDNFKSGSDAIKRMKDTINESTAHANIVYANNNFKLDLERGKFVTPFFDIEDDYLVKTSLWQIANVSMGLMDLLYGVNKGLSSVKFIDDFIPRLKKLEAENHKLKTEMMNTDRYKRSKKLSSNS